MQELKESRNLKHRELDLVIGNKLTTIVTRIREFEFVLSCVVQVRLLSYLFSPNIVRNNISLHRLYKDRFRFLLIMKMVRSWFI